MRTSDAMLSAGLDKLLLAYRDGGDRIIATLNKVAPEPSLQRPIYKSLVAQLDGSDFLSRFEQREGREAVLRLIALATS